MIIMAYWRCTKLNLWKALQFNDLVIIVLGLFLSVVCTYKSDHRRDITSNTLGGFASWLIAGRDRVIKARDELYWMLYETMRQLNVPA